MATYRHVYDSNLSRYYAKKRQLDASMLELSERMRQVSKARDNYRDHDNDIVTPALEIRAQKPNLYRNNDSNHRRRNHSSYYYPSRYERPRPLSFNENDIYRNRLVDYEKPTRDTKSERPIVIPSGMSDFDLPGNPGEDQVIKVSLVNAADLYELVDTDALNTAPKEKSVQIANIKDGIKLVEDIEMKFRKQRESQESHRTRTPAEEEEVAVTPRLKLSSPAPKNAKEINVSDNSSFLTGRAIKTNIGSRPKYRSNSRAGAEQSDNNKHNKHDSKSHKSKRDKTTSPSNDEEANPLDVLLQQAALQHMTSPTGRLLLRPKRAKRMTLHQPELLAIPEDGGTFYHADGLASARERMLGNIPVPSSSSLRAVKGSSPRDRRDDIVEADYVAFKSRSPRDKVSESDSKRSDMAIRNSKKFPTADMERLLATSVYPTLPWEAESGHDQKVVNVIAEKNSHKQKAQRKMKRLIFLRDQPDQYYKREI